MSLTLRLEHKQLTQVRNSFDILIRNAIPEHIECLLTSICFWWYYFFFPHEVLTLCSDVSLRWSRLRVTQNCGKANSLKRCHLLKASSISKKREPPPPRNIGLTTINNWVRGKWDLCSNDFYEKLSHRTEYNLLYPFQVLSL